jgi:hypothetical protein
VDPGRRQLTLNLPPSLDGQPSDSLRLRARGITNIEKYEVGDVIGSLEGTVFETRHSLLEAQARKALGEQFDPKSEWISVEAGEPLPNPLLAYRKILHDIFPRVKLSPIHGDLNLENILVDPDTRDAKVIDFATVRQGHVLHDLLRLETEIVTKVIPELLVATGQGRGSVRLLYHCLHQVTVDDTKGREPSLPHRDFQKPFAVLMAIRKEARKYLFDPEDHAEYYYGLILYLLGALKFKNLDQTPHAKATAFLAAATTVELLKPNTEPLASASFSLRRPLPVKRARLLLAFASIILLGLAFLLAVGPDSPSAFPTNHLCEIDRVMAVAIEDGQNSHNDLEGYFADANPELYEHFGAFEQAYLSGEKHVGLTYVWGSPGAGKSFVSRNRLSEGFPGDSCLVKLGNLFGDDADKLGFEVTRKPDLMTLDGQITYDNLPLIANTVEYDLEDLLAAGGCRQDDRLVPLIMVDDLDEIHTESSRVILRSLDNFILESDRANSEFTQIVVFGRPEGFAPWYQDSKRNDAIADYLNTFWLHGPEFLTIGDVAYLADDQYRFVRGEETWMQMKEDGQSAGLVDGYVDLITRYPFLTYSIQRLAIATILADRALSKPNDSEAEIKSFLFEELLRRAANTHGRPVSIENQYVQLFEEIAVRFSAEDQVDDAGFFTVLASDTVPVLKQGQQTAEVSVRDTLDHSGIAILEPASHSTTRYRFDPFWVHAHLVELRNSRMLSGYEYSGCYE